MIGVVLVAAFSAWPLMALAAEGANDSLGTQLLAFIDSAAYLIGSALAWLIGLVLPGTVDPSLVKPLGYLGLLTLLLLLFSLLEAARKLIWLVVIVGWVLMVARILIEAFRG
ncbi:MAG: hypothetical protein GXO72_00470 [Caldiserica bacterium]|nr:hypothetical protein [Caldisericota bacterium]